MGPRRHIRGTYSKLRQGRDTEDKRRTQQKDRRVIPQFNDLFLPRDENREASGQESFGFMKERFKKPGVLEESTKVRKSKAFRKPLAVNSFLTNSSLGSACHSSGDDTFDRLMGKGRRLPVSVHQIGTGVLSSSNTNSSFDATGLLYQSLQSHVQSQLHSSADEKSELQIVKETKATFQVQGQPSVIFEDSGSIGSDKSPHNSDRAAKGDKCVPVGVSPQLFSSNDEEIKSIKSRKCKKRKSKIVRKVKKTGRSRGRRKDDILSEEPDITDDKKTLKVVGGKSNCNDIAKGSFGSPQNVFQKPSLSVKQAALDSSPYVIEKGVFPSPASLQHFKGFTCTPNNSNFAKAILCQKLRSSQSRLSVTSELSVGSHRSGHSSEARTSTPADTSRNKSLINDLGPWNIQGISPVPKEAWSGKNSPSVFQSPMCSTKSSAYSNQKSGDNPSHRSHYHTCVSHSGGPGDPVKLEGIPSPENRVCKGVSQGSDKIMEDEKPRNFYNSSLELKTGPFKGITIPVFDHTEGTSPNDHTLHSCDRNSSVLLSEQEMKSEVEISADKPVGARKFTAVIEKNLANEKVSQVSNGNVLHEMSQNFSSGMLKQINSFLSRPSFSIPLKTRQQKRKFLNNKQETLSNVKRLTTRQSARISKLQKKRPSANTKGMSNMSQNENVNTDHSTTTEPSPVFPRRRQKDLAIPLTKMHFSGVRMDETRSSVDSAFSNGSLPLPKSNVMTDTDSFYFTKPSPVLPRRTSVRLATKRKIMPRRTSVRLAIKMENPLTISTASSSKDNWSESENISRVSEKAYVSTRSSLRRLRPTKKLSIMQFSLLSVKSATTDYEDSKASIVSENGISYNESVNSHRGGVSQPVNLLTNVNVHQNIVLDGCYLENQVIKEEAGEKSFVSNDSDNLSARDCTSDARPSIKHSLKTRETFVAENLDASILDVSLDDVFVQPFQTAVPAKRGKGWIRSLSIARASFLGTEKIEEVQRRQTVHRMSVGGRRITCHQIAAFPEMSDQIAEVEESCYEDKNPLNQSILCDPRRHVLTLCSQVEPVPVTDCFSQSRLSCCKKIGEGVYGEVFMTKPNPNSMDGATVLKIMPIEGDFDVNGEMQKKFDEILSEIIISLELSNLRNTSKKNNWTENFVHVLNCWCVEGSYHQDMLHLWDLYHEEKGSENDRPDIFPESQLYIVLEFTHGGRDLEGFVFNNASQSLAVFLQIAYSLAVAEQELEFEHRDLHWGNVLVAVSNAKSVDFQINGGTYTLQTQGVKATVIDFTLSRLKAPHCIMYNNLAEDPSLFTAEGDYQFEIYRQMKKANRNDWQSFTPYTNVLWLHYILDKIIKECYYKNVKSKVHKTNLDLLCKLKDNMLQSESATAFVLRREHGID